MKTFYLLAIVVFLSFLSCQAQHGGGEGGVIQRWDIFSLDIGPMEDQIAFFPFDESHAFNQTNIAMRDGLLYIADGNGGKIVRYNSFGDLLFMIFNEETNPRPITLQTNFAEGQQATRWAFSFPLREPGRIAVDSRNHIFVEDRLPHERVRFDTENNVMLDRVILHFDQDGRFIQYLGQDGIGGNPFPRIIGLYTSVMDEIVVVCRLPDGWNIFWFNSSGMLLYLILIDNNAIPMLPGSPSALASVDSITVSPDSRQLLIKVDYFYDIFDESNMRIGREVGSSVIWTLNVEDGSYTNYTEVPLFASAADESEPPINVAYSLLGVMRNGIALLYFPVDTGYSLVFLDTNTGRVRHGLIEFCKDGVIYNNFNLSAEGILIAILIDEYQANLVGWRTDLFVTREWTSSQTPLVSETEVSEEV